MINKNPIQWSLPVSALSPPSFLLEDLTLSNSHLQAHVMINQSHASMNHAKTEITKARYSKQITNMISLKNYDYLSLHKLIQLQGKEKFPKILT